MLNVLCIFFSGIEMPFTEKEKRTLISILNIEFLIVSTHPVEISY